MTTQFIRANNLNTYSSESERPIIVVGTGPAGIRVTEELLKKSPEQPLLLFGDEPWQPYNRVKLSSLLAGDISLDEIDNSLTPPSSHNLVEHHNLRIIAIDSTHRHVIDQNGQRYGYSTLILATGSRAHIPNINGVQLKNVFTFRDLKDTEQLKARTFSSRHIVIVGGGLLGLEAAKALHRNNTHVTIIQQASRLMNRQLDSGAATQLEHTLQALGIEVIVGQGVREISSKDGTAVCGVVLRSGEEISCDTVLICAGIKPNVELARKAWIPVGIGIKVNDQLQTKDPNIFAIGECAEHRGKTYGLVSPGYEQAAIVATIIATLDKPDRPLPTYLGSNDITQLKVIGKPVFSMGDAAEPRPRPGLIELIYHKRSAGLYRKLSIHRGEIIGALAIGEWGEIPRLREQLTQKRPVHSWQLVRFKITGSLWNSSESQTVANWSDSAVVCNCNSVTKGTLVNAIDRGCHSVAALAEATKATTVCGSCKPLLENLVGSEAEKEATQGFRWLLGTTMIAMIATLLTFLVPGAQNASSVQDISLWEYLRTDSLWKQVTGFTILGLSTIALFMSLRKRIKRFNAGSFPMWRLFHAIIGTLCIFVLVLHTGFHLGENLNRWLILNFLGVLVAGAGAGLILALEHKLTSSLGRKLRTGWIWMHLLLFWPLPVLLSAHVVSVYYF